MLGHLGPSWGHLGAILAVMGLSWGHIQNLLEKNRNLGQFLFTADAIWPVSDQFKVLTYLGGGPFLTVLALFALLALSEYMICIICIHYLHCLQYLTIWAQSYLIKASIFGYLAPEHMLHKHYHRTHPTNFLNHYFSIIMCRSLLPMCYQFVWRCLPLFDDCICFDDVLQFALTMITMSFNDVYHLGWYVV
jgi:hypothetical protein